VRQAVVETINACDQRALKGIGQELHGVNELT
jgi:hypothetical protein